MSRRLAITSQRPQQFGGRNPNYRQTKMQIEGRHFRFANLPKKTNLTYESEH